MFPWLLRRDLPHFATREIPARGGAIRGGSTLGVPLALHFAELKIEEAVHNLNCPTAPARLVACEFNALAATLDFA